MVVKRALRDGIIKNLLSGITVQTEEFFSDEDDDDDQENGGKSRIDLKTAKALINALANWAGKGKDEIIQVLCREIGLAIAAVLKEPLKQVIENRTLRVSLELVPKTKDKAKNKNKQKGKDRDHDRRPTAKAARPKQKTGSKKPPQQP